MNIYKNRQGYKFIILTVALVIGISSVWYTNLLVNNLALRERKLIDLSAKAYKQMAMSTDSDDLVFLFTEIIEANNSIPMILTDDKQHYISHRNLDLGTEKNEAKKAKIIASQIALMSAQYDPILIEFDGVKQYIYYKNSFLITQLKYYPLVQLTVISILGLIAYMAFSNSRRAEQNRVWVGLAKETAHQLGTPLSSLMAWLEFFKTDPEFNHEILAELEKDIQRLEMITSRFSNIGSVPALCEEDVSVVIQDTVNYLSKRVTAKIAFSVQTENSEQVNAMLNASLFGWVIENICKNAVDAIGTAGKINIIIGHSGHHEVFIDITDTGKGMTKNQMRRVFDAGFTTKKRGWGLGLTLVKRIVENYHRGRIFVKHSEPGKGTTFRIILKQFAAQKSLP